MRGRLRRTVSVWVDLFDRHELLTYATAIAYRALIGLAALSLLSLGLLDVIGRRDLWERHVGPAVEAKVLPAVYAGIEASVQRIFESGGAGLVAAATGLAIWNISSAVRACMGGLNRIYEADETRPAWIRFPLSFALALATIVVVLGSFVLVVALKGVVTGGIAGVGFTLLRWLGAFVLVGLGIALLVHFAPAERRSRGWVTTGTLLVVISWLVASAIFGWYVSSVADFRSAVGTVAVLFVLTAYLYTSSLVFLIGIQLDELLRTGSGRDGGTLVDLVRALL